MAVRRWLCLVAVVVVTAACGEEAVQPLVSMPATIEQLTGAWAATPYLLDSTIWTRAEEACRKDVELGRQTRAILIDARGAGVLTVRMTGENSGGCNALQVLGDGTVVGAGGGWSSSGPEHIVAAPGLRLIGAEEQSVGGGGLKTNGWSVMGQAGAGIADVVVDPLGGRPQVRATLMNGWFAAWWPALAGESDPLGEGGGLRPIQVPHIVVRAYDAAGVMVDVIRT